MNAQIPEEEDTDEKESQSSSSNACAASQSSVPSKPLLDTASQNSNLKSKIDEDFMFQMDKGTHTL
jgi:hypothetical protein